MPAYNLTYTFTIGNLRDKVDEEVSRVAQRTVGKEGQSLYDALKIYSKDRPEVERAISDAMDALLLRFVDMGEMVVSQTAYVLKFYAPDVKTENSPIIESEIQRFVVAKAVADWLATRYPDTGKYFADIADVALAKIVVGIRTRVKPTR